MGMIEKSMHRLRDGSRVVVFTLLKSQSDQGRCEDLGGKGENW